MLRIYFLQQWYNLSDPGAQEALYDIQSMRAFCNLELGRDPIPDETTILNFRHLNRVFRSNSSNARIATRAIYRHGTDCSPLRPPHVRRLLRLAYIAPEIVEAIAEGRQPRSLTVKLLL